MMAITMARLMAQAVAFLGAFVACPVVWFKDGGVAALVTLLAMYAVGSMIAPSEHERKEFEKFAARR